MSTITDLLSALRSDAAATAHDLGHALPGLDDASLREVHNELARIEADDPPQRVAAGVLLDVVNGYRAGRRKRVALTLPAGVTRAVLCQLERQPATTSELADTIGCARPQISRSIARLRELDLVDPPQREAADGRRVEHRLSLTAKAALARLDARARRAAVWRLSAFAPAEDTTLAIEDTATSEATNVEPMIPRPRQPDVTAVPAAAYPIPAVATAVGAPRVAVAAHRVRQDSTGPIALVRGDAVHKKDE